MIDRKYLDALDAQIDDEIESTLLHQWKDFCDGNGDGVGIFSPRRARSSPANFDWPRIMINDAIKDPDLLALSEYAGCAWNLSGGGGYLLSVRANYGTGIITEAFGARPYIMPYDTNTLPTTCPLPGSTEAIRRVLANGVPAFDRGFAGEVFRAAEVFLEAAAHYPMIAKHVHIYEPDIQGPLDLAEMLWGGGLHLAIYDEPELVKALLELTSDAIIALRRRWDALCPSSVPGYNVEWGTLYKGGCVIRNDSAMNISGEMYRDFVMKYDQKVLDALGGGGVHFCGRGEHYVKYAAQLRGLSAINMSQPEYNNMAEIYRNTVDKGIALTDLNRQAAERALERGRDLRGWVNCM